MYFIFHYYNIVVHSGWWFRSKCEGNFVVLQCLQENNGIKHKSWRQITCRNCKILKSLGSSALCCTIIVFALPSYISWCYGKNCLKYCISVRLLQYCVRTHMWGRMWADKNNILWLNKKQEWKWTDYYLYKCIKWFTNRAYKATHKLILLFFTLYFLHCHWII